MSNFSIFAPFVLLFLFQGLAPILTTQGRGLTPTGLFDDAHVFVTLNEVASVDKSSGQIFGRELELNWVNFDYPNYAGHSVKLFDHDPEQDPSSPLSSHTVGESTGYVKTNFRLEVLNFTSVRQEFCLAWMGYFRSGDTRPYKSNCLRLYPTWMNDIRDIIGNKPLRKLMIPGTHDAGAWIVYDGSFASDGILARFTYTQEEHIYNQLVSGVRYLDVRVGHYPSSTGEEFWVNHDLVKIRELKNLLQDVLKFVTEFKEVVFMDFHRFPQGFTSESIHEKLYDFLLEHLGDVLAPRSLTIDATLNQLLNAKKYVVLTYNDDFYTKRNLLWSPLQHGWGDKNTVEKLLDYLPTAISEFGCTNRFWSAMAELSPAAGDIITRPNYGLRNMAADVNKPLNVWYKTPQWYSKSNIVSTDYYFGNDLIQTCIKVNRNSGITC
ncbi:unnamed protein product [Allacma fusca]|uniref:Uncharacterized protein n=1 Tax=Allacma fusca TaxID=39272 RepID=A0A8J2J5I3_9HEXA|nr:unnamed protein product [Allacma fusca]